MYRFHCGGEAGETARSGRLKPWTSLGAADRLIFVPGFLVAACFIATSPVTESLQSPCVNNSKGQQSLCLIAGAVDLAWPRRRMTRNSLRKAGKNLKPRFGKFEPASERSSRSNRQHVHENDMMTMTGCPDHRRPA